MIRAVFDTNVLVSAFLTREEPACALAAGAEYVVTRDHDLLSRGAYTGITIIAPEPFLRIARGQ